MSQLWPLPISSGENGARKFVFPGGRTPSGAKLSHFAEVRHQHVAKLPLADLHRMGFGAEPLRPLRGAPEPSGSRRSHTDYTMF